MICRYLAVLAACVFLLSPAAGAEVVVNEVAYEHQETVLKGFMVQDTSFSGQRPGVLVVHEWWGLNDYVLMRARQLARMGYRAFAADMYGQGRSTDDPNVAGQWAGHLRGSPLMRARAVAGLEQLRRHELVDPERLAAIGFCFGGTTVLELAYSGADLRGVVSFHGGLSPLKEEDREKLTAKLLVLHGSEDPLIKPEAIDLFQERLEVAEADWQMISYGGAVHSFSNPKAGDDPSDGVAYDPSAARRSWKHMQLFFEEIFSGHE